MAQKKRYDKSGDIKVGVVGYGGAFNMGRSHMTEMKKAGMRPFAVCEIDPDRRAVAEDEFPGVETYGSLDEMLAQSDVDLITHITPHHLHYPLASQCVKAGKHVVTEKPFVVTTSEADRLIAQAEKAGVVVSTYHNRHWDGWILRAKREIVDKGVIGDVVRAELRMGGRGMPGEWWRTSESVSGGVLYDWGVHLLEYALQVVPGEVVEVVGYAHRGYWESQAPKNFRWRGDMNEDEATAVVRFSSGAHVNLRVTTLDPTPAPPLAFFGTKGSYVVERFFGGDGEPGWRTRVAGRGDKVVEKTGKNPPSRGERFYKNVAEHLCGEADLIITPQWARRPIHIIDLAKQSAAKGKAVKAKYG